ncbi:Golgi CORVET complex core vacuolar protein 8-domain-containing protein [Gymnopilus junonius]|uniref:Golgi CORVET complex core vacuolar protein 8-domain-containing protein n=1 Tax=Gymnopilus junonius TaxID=109634 RepID=A0A9P5NRG9_GYMJU|nr:Golgi CORVET complex core vacuolar protein 8-domain-containing protein [Gymnopilus junonius]
MTPSGAGRSDKQLSTEFEDTLPEADDDETYLTEDGDTLTHAGDYSSHMEELFNEDDAEFNSPTNESEEEFVYSGADAEAAVSYSAQLRDVLGQDHEGDEEPHTSALESGGPQPSADETVQHFDDVFSNNSPSASVVGLSTPDSGVSSPESKFHFKLARPFLHPTVSRLRSYTPQSSNARSNASSATSHSHLFDGKSPPLSHFSSLSRASSISNLPSVLVGKSKEPQKDTVFEPRQVFKWTELQAISRIMYSKASQKVSNVLGAPLLGSPTTLAANGLICLGTTEGKVVVHDFNQTLICVCDSNIPGAILGSVTAVALSHDHTFVASGHATGHILLYDLKRPRNPVRSIAPTTMTAVASGRKEGHLQGSSIINIGFVAGRHTALVSADEHGLAFFHSLGKFLFVEAPDILRVLGRYPDVPVPDPIAKAPLISSATSRFSPGSHTPQRRKPRFTILAMSPLPLGTTPHPTDNYNPVALLTPTKLVVIGLRPTPRTWFKCPREFDQGGSGRSAPKWTGSLAWFPSVLRLSGVKDLETSTTADTSTTPTLAYSWGRCLHLIRVFESRMKVTVKNSKTGKLNEVETGTITHERFCKWTAEDDILALQWLNSNQLVICTAGTLEIYDLSLSRLVERIAFDGLALTSPFPHLSDRSKGFDNQVFAHSIRVYKGKIFLLKKDQLVVGTLLTWADRILTLVENGEFLKAIELTRTYYTDEAPGNRNNLPTDPIQRRSAIGEKLLSLMDASTQYAFSEDRMTDDTHTTPDNRGVDRTGLFKGLIAVCCRASIALNDFDYLFEDLFQKYDDSGIASIYLQQLEPFILDGQIRHVPPRITQRLVSFHAESGHPEHVERIIWHMDPSCLDLNQAIRLCQQYHLYDALIFVYTRAMRDYVSPIVEMLGVIRGVMHFKNSGKDSFQKAVIASEADSSVESAIVNAYKVYPYLANVLSGLAYPSEEPLEEDEAFQAKKDVYAFLFFGRSSVWPPGEQGKVILTSDEIGGVEPTYPYARQLLLFDSESFLHSLDIAFEDAYFNDKSQTISRLMIVRIILEIVSSGQLPQGDITMVNIFVARNVPKYPQFLPMTPSALHSILIGLSEDTDPKTREDRQLAAEYLLSVYNPHDSDQITILFERAGFFRILRSWYYHDRQWTKLLTTYVDDPDINSLELLNCLDGVLSAASRFNKDVIPGDLAAITASSLRRLLQADFRGTAHLLDKFAPDLHFKALAAFGDHFAADHERYEYLRSLLNGDLGEEGIMPSSSPSVLTLLPDLYKMFLDLQCQFHPEDVIRTLQHSPKEALDKAAIVEICESRRVYEAVVWTINWQGDPQLALLRAEKYQRSITNKIVDILISPARHPDIGEELHALRAIGEVSRDICMEHSRTSSTTDVPLEDLWFQLLNSQIHGIQTISSHERDHDHGSPPPKIEMVLMDMRALVQNTFSSLVSITSTSSISFPRLFKRLVNATPPATGAHHTEFRMILTGMLESYRSDEDLLVMLKHLVDRDLFEVVSLAYQEQACGWAPLERTCQYCHQPFAVDSSLNSTVVSPNSIIVSRTGSIFHERCRPLETTLSRRPTSVR